jgi:hypothetical protein
MSCVLRERVRKIVEKNTPRSDIGFAKKQQNKV